MLAGSQVSNMTYEFYYTSHFKKTTFLFDFYRSRIWKHFIKNWKTCETKKIWTSID